MEVLDGSLWYRSAKENAGKLHLDAATLIEMHSKVVGWMGAEWVKRQESRRANKALPIGAIHPLFTALRSSSVRSLVEVAELATYLAAFDQDPAFQSILEDLRSDKFDATLFELAMAYRWKWAGAAVALAPTLSTGRVADFSATIGPTAFFVEVSAVPADDFKAQATRLQHTIKVALDAAKPRRSLALELVVESHRPGDVHGEVSRGVRAGIRRFSAAAPVAVQLSFGTVIVRELEPWDVGPAGDWNTIAHFSIKEKPADGTLYDAHLGKTVARGHSVYVRTPPRFVDPYDVLLKKFENERKQLSGTEAPRVILLDATGIQHDVLAMDLERVNATIGQRLLGLEKVSAVWLLSRVWLEEGRVGYRAVTMSNPRARTALPREFVGIVRDHEWRYDLASGKKIDWAVPAGRIDDS